MIKPTKRATIYLDPDLHKILKIKAAQNNCSVSSLINDAVRYELQEELEDIADIEKRKNEPTVTYEELLKDLKESGKL